MYRIRVFCRYITNLFLKCLIVESSITVTACNWYIPKWRAHFYVYEKKCLHLNLLKPISQIIFILQQKQSNMDLGLSVQPSWLLVYVGNLLMCDEVHLFVCLLCIHVFHLCLPSIGVMFIDMFQVYSRYDLLKYRTMS